MKKSFIEEISGKEISFPFQPQNIKIRTTMNDKNILSLTHRINTDCRILNCSGFPLFSLARHRAAVNMSPLVYPLV